MKALDLPKKLQTKLNKIKTNMNLPRTNQLSILQCEEGTNCGKEEFELEDNDEACILLPTFNKGLSLTLPTET